MNFCGKTRRLWLPVLATFLLLGLISCVSTIFYIILQYKSIDGYYEISSTIRCGCGYRVYLYINDNNLYNTCPGHNEYGELWGTLVYTNKSLMAVNKKTGDVYAELFQHGVDLRIIEKTGSHKGCPMIFPRVKNPWQIWIPRVCARIRGEKKKLPEAHRVIQEVKVKRQKHP